MKALRIVSRVVTTLYILSFLFLVLAAAAWRELVGVATYTFLAMMVVSVLMIAIERRGVGSRSDEA
jgi:hypothetical protein